MGLVSPSQELFESSQWDAGATFGRDLAPSQAPAENGSQRERGMGRELVPERIQHESAQGMFRARTGPSTRVTGSGRRCQIRTARAKRPWDGLGVASRPDGDQAAQGSGSSSPPH